MSRKTGTPQEEVNIKSMKFAKASMSKKLFGWTNSLKKSDKLVTDAVVLDENDLNASGPSDSTKSNALSVSPLSSEMGFSRYFDNQNMSVIRANDLLVEPSTPNSALSLNNTQQNVYQFSHINGLHIGTNVQINHNVEQLSDRRSSSSGDIIQKTRSIDVMMRSNEPVNERVMDVISTHLGENWRSLFRNLGFSDGQIDQMKEDFYINGVKEVIYRLLLDYSRNNDDACLGHITKVMWKLGFKECVKILKVHWKSGDLVTTETNGSGNDEASCSKGKSVD